MARSSYAEELASARVMLTGLKSNAERLIKRGIDQRFITEFEEAITAATALNAEQEALMARRMEKTVALKEWLTTIGEMNATGKRLIKVDYPKESWREFGIKDRRR